MSDAATPPLLLPGFLPEQPRLEQLLLLAERLASQVDVALRRLDETTAQSGEPLVVEVLVGAWGFGEANAEALRYRDTLVGDPSDWLGEHLPSSDQPWRLWYRVEPADGSGESEPSHDG